MKIYVLAAGYATRLYPLTEHCAKPLLEVGGRAILSRILDRALALPDISEVVVIGNHRFSEDLEDWRARHDGVVAELGALRASQALSWWRRLLPAPKEPTA